MRVARLSTQPPNRQTNPEMALTTANAVQSGHGPYIRTPRVALTSAATGLSLNQVRNGSGTLLIATLPDMNITTVNSCSITKRISGRNGTTAAIRNPSPAANTNIETKSKGNAK